MTEQRDKEEILDVEYITADELRELHPGTKPLPENTDDAECHNCGNDFSDEWEERKMPSGPSLGENWHYRCPTADLKFLRWERDRTRTRRGAADSS